MTKEEYEAELKKIDESHKKSKRDLMIKYGMSMAIFKEGDIIKENSCTLLIDKVSVNAMWSIVQPAYHGVVLKKDLTPRKDNTRSSIYGNEGVELVKSGLL